MSVAKYIEYYTYEDYKNWEGDWELIEGVPVAMAPSPLGIHQYLNGRIFRILDEELENCVNCVALIEEDWIISSDTILRSDTLVVCKEDLFSNVKKTPHLIVEVVSKSTKLKDETIKKEIYEKEGVKTYILIYPDILKARVFILENGEYKDLGMFVDEVFETNIEECKIKIDFKKVFSRVKRLING